MRTNRLLVQAQNLLISRKLLCTTPAGDCFAFPNPSVRGDHSINAAQLPGFAALGVRGEDDDFNTETPYRNMLHFSPYEHWSAVFVFFTIRYGRSPRFSLLVFTQKCRRRGTQPVRKNGEAENPLPQFRSNYFGEISFILLFVFQLVAKETKF